MTPTLYQSLAGEIGQLRALLGRHVVGRAGESDAVVQSFGLDFGDQTKVENHDAAFSGDQDVRRFDVAMQLAGFMQAVQTLGQLAKRQTQTILIQLDVRPSPRELLTGVDRLSNDQMGWRVAEVLRVGFVIQEDLSRRTGQQRGSTSMTALPEFDSRAERIQGS